MDAPLDWDEAKRQANLAKLGLDFADAGLVLDSSYRLDIQVVRNGESRTMSFSYVMHQLAVLTVVHVEHKAVVRIVSFRRASKIESEVYHEWLAQEED